MRFLAGTRLSDYICSQLIHHITMVKMTSSIVIMWLWDWTPYITTRRVQNDAKRHKLRLSSPKKVTSFLNTHTIWHKYPHLCHSAVPCYFVELLIRTILGELIKCARGSKHKQSPFWISQQRLSRTIVFLKFSQQNEVGIQRRTSIREKEGRGRENQEEVSR